MTVGYKNAAGQDFDILFGTGSGGSATGYKTSAGADLNTRYAAHVSGGTTVTGYRTSGGTDLGSLFQLIGAVGLGAAASPNPTSASFSCNSNTTSCATSKALQANSAVTANGGTAPYTYAWSFLSNPGGATFAAATNAASQGFIATPTQGQTISGTARCVVRDAVSATVNVDVPFSLSYAYTASTLAVGLSTGSVTGSFSCTGGTCPTTQAIQSSTVIATPTGGSGGYNYAWSVLSGGATLAVSSASASQAAVTNNSQNQTIAGVLQCVVTDSVGNTATQTCNYSNAYTFTGGTLTATVPSSVASAYQCTQDPPFTLCPATTALNINVASTASNGTQPYSYNWTFVSNPNGFALTNGGSVTTVSYSTPRPGSQHTTATYTGSVHCTVTDSASAVVTTNTCVVTFTYEWD